MKRWMIVLMIAALGAVAPRMKIMEVDDVAVVPKIPFRLQPMLEVKGLRACDGTRQDTGAKITIISGELWNLTGREDFAVDIEIKLWAGTNATGDVGVGKVHIERPGDKVPVHFTCLAPACYNEFYEKGGCRYWFQVRTEVVAARPQITGRN